MSGKTTHLTQARPTSLYRWASPRRLPVHSQIHIYQQVHEDFMCIYTSDITCLFTYVDTRTKTSVCVCECIYKYTNICKRMQLSYVYMYIQIYIHVYTHICMHTYIHIYIHVCIHVRYKHTLFNKCDKNTCKEIHKHICINWYKSTKTYSHVNTNTRYSKCAKITCIFTNTYICYLHITAHK